MRTTPSKPLRTILQGAVNSRLAALRNGRSRRPGEDHIRAAVMRAEAFLASYPMADDARVRAYVADHLTDIHRIVPGNQPGVVQKLIGN